jgi:hypothetical protein
MEKAHDFKIKFISSDEVLTEAKDLYRRWPTLEPNAKRKIIENITDRITIRKDDVTIDPVTPYDMVTSGNVLNVQYDKSWLCLIDCCRGGSLGYPPLCVYGQGESH